MRTFLLSCKLAFQKRAMLRQLRSTTLAPLAVAAYLVPSIVAKRRKHPQLVPIFALNLLLGWAFAIGWVGALVWALIRKEEIIVENRTATDAASQIEHLAELRSRGLLTDEEFAAQKAKLLA